MAIAPNFPNFTDIYRGDTLRLRFEFKKSGVPIDITGWKLGFTLKAVQSDPDSGAAVQHFTTAGDDDMDDLPNGIMYLQVESDVMDGPVGGKPYFYDIQRSIPRVGKPPLVRTLFAGRVNLIEDVTDTP